MKAFLSARMISNHLNGLEGLNVEDVVGVVERRLLVVERREPHPLEVATIALLSAHHDPHRTPLSQVDGLDDPGNLVDEGDGAGDVVQHGDVANLSERTSLSKQNSTISMSEISRVYNVSNQGIEKDPKPR